MSMSFTKKLVFTLVGMNLTIAALLYRYTSSEAPFLLIIQLMIPLIIWQIVLSISFFPDHFIAQFLDDFYGHDGAAGDQAPPLIPGPQQSADLISSIHSHGDVPRTPTPEQQSSFEILF